ncbi:phosphatidylglycerol lysyltransferase domain-containing protein [uncultured Mailhella sp.]|uniref:DUF2156 domain-containing protein n=1 Tax=uncultured Mailhella sp. TaxID=1981031 RepID=UPI0025DC30C3|nr:phosphatidylglycerol lysyltransferase domain-containing protein [uncultured Mailhella sp.]
MNLPSGYVPVTLDLYDDYHRLFERTPQPTADLTFTNLWGWAEHFGLGLSFRDGLCWICQTRPEVRYWAPVGDWNAADWAAQPEIRGGVELFRVPEVLTALLTEALGSRVTAENDRGQWEYLYDRNELAELPGAKFHKKKTHVNGYRRRYGEDYRALGDVANPDGIEHVLRLQEEWCKWRDCENSPSLQAENEAIFRVVGNWDRLPGLVGGALYVEDKIGAFAVGEKVGDMMVVHFEKVQAELKGVYQAINQAFVSHSAQDVSLINREQDMDEPGLRQAKETYNPVGFLKKSRLVIASDAE